MPKRINLIGKRFGRWLVLSYDGNMRWNCRCNCGTEKSVLGSSLRRGDTKGCIRCHPGRGNRRTHGQKNTRLYDIWCKMKGRCLNPNNAAFHRYGARGITVCDEWRDSFESFAAWAHANGYAERLTIERQDNDRGYSADNCRWATPVLRRGERRP